MKLFWACLFVKSLSVTVIVKLPAVVGVPVITPLDELIENAGDPGGKPVALHAYGGVPPLPLIVKEYGIPTTPPVTPVVVMLGLSCAKTSGAKLKAKANRPNNGTATFNREIISSDPVAAREFSLMWIPVDGEHALSRELGASAPLAAG